jgi:hypothetical protein
MGKGCAEQETKHIYCGKLKKCNFLSFNAYIYIISIYYIYILYLYIYIYVYIDTYTSGRFQKLGYSYPSCNRIYPDYGQAKLLRQQAASAEVSGAEAQQG